MTTLPPASRPAAAAPARSAAPRRRVLMLTHRLPYPPDRGDRIRSYHMLRELRHHFQVSLACTTDEKPSPEHCEHLSAMTEQLAVQQLSHWGSRLRAGAGLVRGRAITPSLFYDPALARIIQRWHAQRPFDAVLTFCTGMIHYARLLTAPDAQPRPVARHVLDLVDVDSIKWADYARTTRRPMRWLYSLEAWQLRRIEAGSRDRVEAVTVISDAEARAYRQAVAGAMMVRTVGNGVDVDYYQPLPDVAAPVLAFVGVLNYRPNVEAVQWFARHVMPPLRERVPGATLRVVGRSPNAAVRQLDGRDGVEVVGPVDDVRESLAGASVVVAPLRMARGVQNKVLEAMAVGRAVVCTPAAFEGIHATPGEHLLVADTPDEQVRDLHRLLTDAPLRQGIARAARQHIEQRYRWAEQLRPMVELIGGTG